MPTLTCHIDDRLKACFADEARRRGLCEAQLLRQMVESALPERIGASEIPPPAPMRRMTIRIPAHVRQFVDQSAKQASVTSSRWVSMFLVSHAARNPQLSVAQWSTIEQCSRELNALGRNLNQITRALHAGYGYQADVALLRGLTNSVDQARTAIERAFVSARQAWGLEDMASVAAESRRR